MDRNLEAFLAIVADGNLSGAAARIALTQPSLTKRLAKLEEELGAQLFDRHRRGMSLTAAGRLFLERARRIDQEYRQAREEIRALSQMGLGTLRVGAGPLFHLRYVAPLFDRIRNRFPALTFDLIANHNSVTLPMLLDGRLDVVLGAMEPLEPNALITAIPVAEVEQSVVMAIDDPLADRGVLKPGDLLGMQWVAYSAATDNVPMLREYCTVHKLGTPKIIARSTSFATALDLTRELRAKMMAPLQLARNVEAAGLTALPTDPPISRVSTGAYIRQSSLNVPAIACLLEELRALAGTPMHT